MVFLTGMWAKRTRNFNYANQNTNSGIEGYHSAIKGFMAQHKTRLGSRRVDWLAHFLCTVMHNFFVVRYFYT